MTTRATLARMGKQVAAELAGGHPGDAAQQAMEAVGAAPELAGDLIELLIKEVRRSARMTRSSRP